MSISIPVEIWQALLCKIESMETQIRAAQKDPESSQTVSPSLGAPRRIDQDLIAMRNPRNPRGAFSPGYGVRGTQVHEDPSEDLISLEGTTHRIYPAPKEPSPPSNLEEGWSEPSVTIRHSDRPVIQAIDNAQQRQAPLQEAIHSPGSPSLGPGGGSFIPWQGGVVYKDESLNAPVELSVEDLLSGLSGKRESWGRSKNKGVTMTESLGWQPQGSHLSGPPGSSGACRKCGKEGHWSKECPNPGFGPGASCHNCGVTGHMTARSRGRVIMARELKYHTGLPRVPKLQTRLRETMTVGGKPSKPSARHVAAGPHEPPTSAYDIDNSGTGVQTPSRARAEPHINPDRLRMMGRGGKSTGRQYQPGPGPIRQGPTGSMAPQRDNGWGSQSKQVIPERDANLVRTDDTASNGFGGW
ncbi:hypothetical protein BD324DRAFT_649757 [Kockovaella imperatae]|uniref:CCHC-type domain-containing protein n=1 Tax=Kockovaella imperatae TaxID=4999 RepID=A0A1Y1UMM5_9TREE|nr:hypothetical protein BD324DRAFT_649757 [Kockovaella imperatae]ORX38385.1 hypothetical protein BD324DRAFT_649757 [Kockovaella imperatae]